MAPIPGLATGMTPPTASEATIYPATIVLATLSLLVSLLVVPPMCWHYRNRNIGAMLLVAWIIVMNLQSFINALIWPNDDIAHWYNGAGLCDVEVKMISAWSVAAPAALACVLRGLANALDTKQATLVKSKAQRRKNYAIDLAFCLGFPALEMLFHYIVQPTRYALYGISGCAATVSHNWLTVVLMFIPPVIWTLVDTVYAILVLARLCRYRVTFGSILASSNMTKNRFLRLYVFCLILVIAFVPLQAWVLSGILEQSNGSYSWHAVHDPATWNDIIMVPSNGRVLYESYIWLGGGFFIFIFFGLGRDAVAMYRTGLLATGFDRVFPGLRPDYTARNSATGTITSLGSKARLFFKRKSSMSTWRSDTGTSRIASFTEPVSPRNMSFLEAISEDGRTSKDTVFDAEKATTTHARPSLLGRIFAVLKLRTALAQRDLSLPDISGQRSTISSDVSGSHPSPAIVGNAHTASMEVIVRKEVRQDSETAETAAFGR